MENVYSVRQVNSYLKNMFAQDYMLNRIYVKGEVSNLKYHTSGHIYFSLKDESGTIACVMFAGSRSGLSFRMREGQQVIVLGNISVYERDGKYQLYARQIVLDGAGELYERFEALKRELEEMGMFAPEYKLPIPKYPSRIGIVTAPAGAAIRDIINISKRRNPFVQLILYPALVQGEGAKESIVQGIRMLESKQVDVIIVGRGGGSIEDLWAFNDENVACAIFNCRVPVISAVGHETDTTIADFVADLRAPTPSAAAELAVPRIDEILGLLDGYQTEFRQQIHWKIQEMRQEQKKMELKLRLIHPRSQLDQKRQYLADLEDDMRGSMEQKILEKRHRYQLYLEKMKGLSPLKKLEQGFAYVADEQGHRLTSVEQTSEGEELEIYVTDGWIRAEVLEKGKEAYHGNRERT